VCAARAPHSRHAAVNRAGEISAQLLSDFHRHSTFRRVISQAMSSPPYFPSLDALSRALTPFERPNRSANVQAVYLRWRAGAMEPAALVDSVEDVSSSSNTSGRRRARIRRVWAIAAIITAFAGAGLWELNFGRRVVILSGALGRPGFESIRQTLAHAVQVLPVVRDGSGKPPDAGESVASRESAASRPTPSAADPQWRAPLGRTDSSRSAIPRPTV